MFSVCVRGCVKGLGEENNIYSNNTATYANGNIKNIMILCCLSVPYNNVMHFSGSCYKLTLELCVQTEVSENKGCSAKKTNPCNLFFGFLV